MASQFPRIAETLATPDKIIRSRTDADVELFYKLYQNTPVMTKFPCVVVKTLPDATFIITAYYPDTIKRGEALWEQR